MNGKKILNAFKKILFAQCRRAPCWAIQIICTGCGQNIGASDFCAIYRPVFADYENDTAETAEQIDWNNAAFDELCDVKKISIKFDKKLEKPAKIHYI